MGSSDLILAVDGGGSTSDVYVYEPDGVTVLHELIGPLSCKSSTNEEVLASLKAMRKAIAKVAPNITSAVLGLSGLDTPEDFTNMADLLVQAKLADEGAVMRKATYGKRCKSSWGFPMLFCSDAMLPLFANGYTHGVVVIAGTGGIALRIDEDGSITRFGGYGYRTSDEGSGTWVGTHFMTEALHACDKVRSDSPFVKSPTAAEKRLVEDAFDAITDTGFKSKAKTLEDMADAICQWSLENDDPKAFAALARHCLNSTGKACKKIRSNAAKLLARMAVDATDKTTPAIVLAGGIFSCEPLTVEVASDIQELAPNSSFDVIANLLPHAYGALAIAKLVGARKTVATPDASSDAVHRSMQGNKGKDTKPELSVREKLREAGLSGYRLQWSAPGRPDIAWPAKKVCIFINGCFWHRHKGCKLATTPKSNVEYWTTKFDRNVERDAKNLKALEEKGWKVHTIWECELKPDRIDKTFDRLVPVLKKELGRD